jgi:hypothetical protein
MKRTCSKLYDAFTLAGEDSEVEDFFEAQREAIKENSF